MGREAVCRYQWGASVGDAKVLLETSELIVRGELKRKASFTEMKDVFAQGEQLTFLVGEDRVKLTLGSQDALRWAQAITDPPSLARKLGIKSGLRVQVIGSIEDQNLSSALNEAQLISEGPFDIAIASVRNQDELEHAVSLIMREMEPGRQLWIAYPKGKGRDLGESAVRAYLLRRGLVDTKVASVSTELTALRFSQRQEKRPATDLPTNSSQD